MTDLPPDSSSDRPSASWRDRYDAARAQGVPLDPASEPVQGVNAYPTSYDRSHLLVTVADGALDALLDQLAAAASDFGWGIALQNMDGTPVTREDASARAQRWRDALELPSHRCREAGSDCRPRAASFAPPSVVLRSHSHPAIHHRTCC